MNAPPKEDEILLSNIAKKPPRKSLIFVPLSSDHENNVDDDSDTELPNLQVPMTVSDIRKNIQMKVLGEKLKRMAQMKANKRRQELENMEQSSTSSAPPPEPFHEPSSDLDAPLAKDTENEHCSSPPPPEPFMEPSPSPEAEPQPSTSSAPRKIYELDKSISLLSPTPSQDASSIIPPAVSWTNIGLFLYDIGRRVEKVSSDGHCLIYSIMQALKLDHNIDISHTTIANRIWKEINERIIFYVQFICGERNQPTDVLEDVCRYIEQKDYTIPVADLIVGAAANALNINLKIYENDKGVKKEIDFEPENAQSSVTVHLLFSCDSNPDGDPNNLTSHYDALVLRDDSPLIQHSNQGPEADTPIILLHDTTSDEDTYVDPMKILKDLSKSIEVSDEIFKYNIEPGERNLLDMTVYTGMAVKRVGFQPYAIDGNVVYEIACKNHEWQRKHEDGRYWKTTSGKNKDLKGTRRCAKCIGPLQCQNKRCVMYRCHAQSNIKSFKKMGDDYLCRSCLQFVSRTWCGARKIIEYNRERETLSIWHQGKHRCKVRPGHKTVEQKHKGKEMIVYIMR